ncbi:Uncharacterised protein [Mycobacteroides abscessus subsp. abscessus]|nr:Uncharacterised protein [Mycobacteroides abscessus subsp. abscessus]
MLCTELESLIQPVVATTRIKVVDDDGVFLTSGGNQFPDRAFSRVEAQWLGKARQDHLIGDVKHYTHHVRPIAISKAVAVAVRVQFVPTGSVHKHVRDAGLSQVVETAEHVERVVMRLDQVKGKVVVADNLGPPSGRSLRVNGHDRDRGGGIVGEPF